MPKTTAQNRATLADLNSDLGGSRQTNRRTEAPAGAPQAQAKPNAALTAAYLRAYLGPKGGLKQDDSAPPRPAAKPISLDYPNIQAQPEFAAEADKLNRFVKELEEANARLGTLYEQLSSQSFTTDAANRQDSIARAESLLEGGADVDERKNLQEEYVKTNKLTHVLREAIQEQSNIVRRVNRKLSEAAGRRYEEEHKERVRRVIAALADLCAANQAEADLRNDLERLGYTEGTLPMMRFQALGDHMDANGGHASYWFQEAQRYVMSAAQLAAGVRKSRLAAALGQG